MRLKGKFVFVLSVLMIFALVASGCNNSTAKKDGETPAPKPAPKKQLVISTGSAGGVFNILGAGIAKVVNDKEKSLEVIATTPGSVSQTPEMINSGQAQLGMSVVDVMARAVAGEGEFKGKKADKVVPLIGLYESTWAYVVMKNSPLKSIKDVEGKRFAVPSESSKQQTVAMIEAAGKDPNKVKWQFMSYQQAVDALLDGNVDVGLFSGYPKNSLLDQLTIKGFRFLEVDKETREKYDTKYPLWATGEIPANTYSGQNEPGCAGGYIAGLYTSSDVDADTAYKLTKTIIENNSDIAAIHPTGNQITLEITKKLIDRNIFDPAKIHPGAARYFKEKGILK